MASTGLDLQAKLYRFDKSGNQWKERGDGSIKILNHKETGKLHLVMRQSHTLKVCANHLVTRSTPVQEHVGDKKSCAWYATDFADVSWKQCKKLWGDNEENKDASNVGASEWVNLIGMCDFYVARTNLFVSSFVV
ncbi:hypothetical protein L1987_50788 [Smallanthus sonchifolius]|uniref:Uncharacterized protein n=1 Tax=Smallanthus sonchifolius TaxID=185202 RepID=A0ACB9EP51_9ASTR|nr:hypothetical protein L1987_50788 [Smallanthus sonchifolius]